MGIRRNSLAGAVRRRIERGGSDRLWTYGHFTDIPKLAAAAALSRLTKKGIIRRVRKGVYYVPRDTRYGETNPDPTAVAAAVLKRRGIMWRASGPAAYNGLGLTTQMSPTPMFAVNRDVRSLKGGPRTNLRFRRVPVVRNLNHEERAVLDALRDVRWIPDTTPSDVVHRISDLFRSGRLSFSRVSRNSKKEPPRVRAILGAIGDYLGENPNLQEDLRKSLDPTTTFRLGISRTLPTAANWNIK